MIYKYKKITDQITTYTPIGEYTELGVVDGFTYIEADRLSDVQHENVVLIPVLSSYEQDKINEQVIQRIRQKYSLNDELQILRSGTADEVAAYNTYVEGCRAWGRTEKANKA